MRSGFTYFSTTEFDEGVMHSIASDDIHYLSVLLIDSHAFLSLRVVRKQVFHLDRGALLTCTRPRTLTIVIDHESIDEVSSEGEFRHGQL